MALVIVCYSDRSLTNAEGINENLSKGFEIDEYLLDDKYFGSDVDVPPPTACVFNDGVDPKQDPDGCFPIPNNGRTFARDNVLFSVSANEPVDTFICSLKDQNGNSVPLVNNQPNPSDCKITGTSTNAEKAYLDLEDGIYTFQAFVTKKVDTNNDNKADITRTGESSIFTFTVGTDGSQSRGAGIGLDPSSPFAADPFILEAAAGITSELKGNFKNLLINEKLGFTNLEKILRYNETINTTSLACFESESEDSSISNSIDLFREFDCGLLLIFASQTDISNLDTNTSKQYTSSETPGVATSTGYYMNDLYIYKVNNALLNGISGSLVSCGFTSPHEDDYLLDVYLKIPCKDVFIAYEISS